MVDTKSFHSALVLLFFGGTVFSQCPPRPALVRSYQTLTRSAVSPQYPDLLRIAGQWESCGYPQDSLFLDLLYHIGRDAGNHRADSVALGVARRALTIAQHPSAALSPSDLPKALFRLGKVSTLLSQREQAGAYLDQSITLSLARNTWRWAALAAAGKAFLSYSTGDLEVSLSWSEKGIGWARKARNTEALLYNQYERVRVLQTMKNSGKLDEALALCLSILAESRQGGSLLSDQALYNRTIGNILKRKGQPARAEPYFLEALRLKKSLNNQEQIASCELELGFYYYDLAQYEKALYYYGQALAKATDFNRKARLYNNIGAAYWKKKNFETALQYYQKGFHVLKTGFNDTLNLALNPSGQAMRLSAQKEYLLTLVQDKADTWLDYAKSTGNRAYFRHALNTYALADKMVDFMRWEHTGTLSKIFWRSQTKGMYERAIETCAHLNDANAAYRFFEKSRAVLLMDRLNELGARQKLLPRQLEEEARLVQQVSSLQNRLAEPQAGTARYDQVLAQLLSAQAQLDDFRRRLETSNPAYFRYKFDNRVDTLPLVQQWLKKENASLVTYFVGDQDLYVLGVTPQSKVLLRQPIANYRQNADTFMRLLSDGSAQNRNMPLFLGSSNALHRLLLAPLRLPKGRVIVSPDGSFIPFDALSRSTAAPEYAVNDYAFSYTYSVQNLLRPRAEARSAGSLLGVAPVQYYSHLGQTSLPGSDEALGKISEQFSSPRLLLRQDATKAAFLENAPDYKAIHLYTHADADSVGREPILYFADSTLRLSDLQFELPNTQLVSLLACKTAVGIHQRGEGVFSLARGFTSVGVPSILTTLWSVEDRPTYAIAERFFAYLNDGLPKDLALQRAKIDYLKGADRGGALPVHWAGPILVGDSHPLSTGTGRWWTAGLLLFAGAALYGGWRFWRTRSRRAGTLMPHW